MTINKKTLKKLNISQNDLVRYMTALSRKSHISETLKIVKLFNINELYILSWYSLTPYLPLFLFLFFPLFPGPFFPHYRGEGQLTTIQ